MMAQTFDGDAGTPRHASPDAPASPKAEQGTESETRFDILANALDRIAALVDNSESDPDEMRKMLQRIAGTAQLALDLAEGK